MSGVLALPGMLYKVEPEPASVSGVAPMARFGPKKGCIRPDSRFAP